MCRHFEDSWIDLFLSSEEKKKKRIFIPTKLKPKENSQIDEIIQAVYCCFGIEGLALVRVHKSHV